MRILRSTDLWVNKPPHTRRSVKMVVLLAEAWLEAFPGEIESEQITKGKNKLEVEAIIWRLNGRIIGTSVILYHYVCEDRGLHAWHLSQVPSVALSQRESFGDSSIRSSHHPSPRIPIHPTFLWDKTARLLVLSCFEASRALPKPSYVQILLKLEFLRPCLIPLRRHLITTSDCGCLAFHM